MKPKPWLYFTLLTKLREPKSCKSLASLMVLRAILTCAILTFGIPIASLAEDAVPGTGEGSLSEVAMGSIVPLVTETGLISLSVDGLGVYPGNTGTIQVEKPSGATVRTAYMVAATTGFRNYRLAAAGDITIDGVSVVWGIETPSSISSWNYWADVTSIVKPKIDAAPAGRVDFTITETSAQTYRIDGELLAVIFDDPNETADNTIVLLFGAQHVSGDTFAIGLAEPIDKSDPNLVLDLSLGISYGYQPAGQYSIVDVNGTRLTTSAGGQDDGAGTNGALLTVGGLDDTNGNPPNPYQTDSGGPRYDDELYNLLPFVADGDTAINVYTRNPSNDDNIFFAALCLKSTTAIVGEGILLAPLSASNPVGDNHAVTATVQDDLGNPVIGRNVTFLIVSGPHAGDGDVVPTDGSGKASFTYTGLTAGTDTIEASFVDSRGNVVTSNQVTKEWVISCKDVTSDIQENKSSLRYNRRTGIQTFDMTLTNMSTDPIGTPLILVVEDISPLGLSALQNPDGFTAGGIGHPFFDYSNSVGADGLLAPGETSGAKMWEVLNPTRVRWSFRVRVFSGCAGSDIPITTRPPVAVDDAYEVDEDDSLDVPALGLLANDTDEDGDPLTATLVSSTTNGTLSLMADGSFSYTPNLNFSGADAFTYRANDGTTDSNIATASITVNPINDSPVANAQSVTTDEDTPVVIALTASDIDGDALTYAIVGGPSNGSLSGTPPSVTYTPNADFQGADSFTFSVNDGTVDSNVATVSITVGPMNDPPTANDDTASTDEDTPVPINVLANDSDPDGDPLMVNSVSDPPNGSVVNNGTDVTYTPDPDFNGVDTFTYTASDGSLTDTATVTVTVNPVNDAPIADDQSVVTDEDTPVGITLTASDVDEDLLTYNIASGPSNGSLSGTPPSVTYTPNADYTGPDSFTFSVNDGTVDSNIATVSITIGPVNDPPTANDDTASTDEDTPVTINVLANDSDPDGDPLVVDSVSDPPNGSVVNNGTDVTYTPDLDFNGVDTFTYTASDGSLTDTATVTVTVNPVNDAPVADDQSVVTDEDTPVGITLTASDVDGDSLTYNIASSPSNGSLSVTPPSVTYTPNTDYIGPDSFTFSANDGTVDSNIATVSITVGPVNDPPTANDDSASTDEDTPVTINVLANDSDPDGDPLVVDSVSDPPNGSVVNNGTDVTYTPDPDFHGVDTFTYTASDGSLTDTATVTVTVNPVNDAPIADDQSVTTDEDTPVGITLTVSDVDEDSLTYNIASGPSNGSLSGTPPTVTYTPNADYTGPDSFTFSVNDGTVDSNIATVSITVNPVNDPPTANDDSASTDEDTPVTINVLANDSDPDGDPLVVDSVSDPPNGTVVNNGTDVTYTPDPDFNGVDTFTYTASDGSLTDTATVTVTVNAVNDAPVADDQSVTTDEDTPVGITLTASDIDGDVLTYAIVGGPSNGSLSGTPPTVTYTPNADYSGPDSFTFSANDGTVDSNVATVSITVNPVNDAPTANDDSASTDEDTPVTVNVLGNDSDPDGDPLMVDSVSDPPNGSVVNNGTDVTYTPDPDFNGVDTFTYTASDGSLTDTATVTVTVNPVNDAPVANDQFVVTDEDTPVGITLTASDVDEDSLAYNIASGPSNGSLSGTPPSVTYTPNADYTGPDSFTFSVNDGTVDSNVATVSITVNPANDPPVITSTPITIATEDVLYAYDVEATDPEGDILTYSLLISPSGMTIDPSTGLIQWTPTSSHVGPNDVVVQVDDGNGGTAMQPFTVIVEEAAPAEDNLRPEVDVVVMPSVASTGDSVTITVNATDDEGVVSKALTVNGAPVSLDGSGTSPYTSAEAGVFTAVGTALDAAGNEGLDSEVFRFLTPGDTTPPTVSITSPADDSELSVPTDIIGTASDPNLILYRLEYSVKDKGEFITFASDTSSVIADVLGTLDPTMLRNGLYDVRLTAEDESGNTASVTRTYQLEGEMKVGNFSISFNDLTIPVTGLPITITRTYDSRVKSKGDFGVGWTLDIKDFEISESCVMGSEWQQTSTGGFLPWYIISPTSPHYVTVTYPDGRTDEFDMQIDPDRWQLVPLQWTTASFAAGSGTFSSLVSLDNNSLWVIGGIGPVDLLDDWDFTIYNPNRYQLTAVDGTVYVINQATGLESIRDTNGNTITFGAAGIIHSAGKSVTFARDAQNRITTITDPLGNMIEYVYDYYGDLVSVTDQEGNITQFKYNSVHGLTEIIDPRGITPARNEYDDQGRLVAIVDADGNRVEFTHSIGTRQEIVTDRLGNVTVYEYDDDGNVVTTTDALGNTTTYTYDSRGNKLTETDPLGNVTTFTYDARDNMLSQTDPLGNTTTFTYNSRNQVLTTTDANGNVTTSTYDASGNLISITDPLANVTTYTYDASGNMTGMTDTLGYTTSYAYDAHGNFTSQTDPLGNVTTYTYDANGNQLSESRTRTTPSGPEAVTTLNIYDRANRAVQTVDPCGNMAATEYNAIGKKSAEIDKLGNRTEYEYDARGNLTRTAYPDGTDELYTYDAENRRATFSCRAGLTFSYTYDALGKLLQTTFPDGMSTQTEYDGAGRVRRVIDERGNDTQYAYDARGRNISVTDPLGNATTYEYDANGNRVRMTDANGNATQYVYDPKNRRIQTIFPDATFSSTGYNAQGKKISETDQAGNTVTFEYDALGRLIRVTDALGNVTSYTYDEVGNLISQTDANGNTTSFEYDNCGRQIERILPLGMAETTAYDPAGNMVSKTDFNGNTITFEYDVNNRLTAKSFPDGSSETYTYTPIGHRQTVTDTRGVTSYGYDLRGRLLQRIDPDGSSVSYTYDAAGNRASVTISSGTTTYSYDPLNRLATVTDPDAGVTAYTYDAVGNRASVMYPNGTVAEYSYDSLNRLIYLLNRKSIGEVISSYAYTLGAAGNRIGVVEDTGRTVDYTYDATYKLVQESINDPVSGARVINYTYDPVGNRLAKTDDAFVTAYTYDANDRLLTEDGTTYAYDNNGNTVRKVDAAEDVSYTYDPLNRLIQANITDPSGTSVVEYAYDVDGIRVQKTVDGTDVTSYLVDKNRDYAQVLEGRDPVGALIVSYVYGDDLLSQNRGGAVSYYHYDGQMCTRSLTNVAEAITDSYVYDAFGTLFDRVGTTMNNYLYAGEQYDPNIGFYYLRGRYYVADLGRFLTMDDWHGTIFDPPSLHKYAYTYNDPANHVDPTGKFGITSLCITIAVIGILAGIAYAVYYWARQRCEPCAQGIADEMWTRFPDVEADNFMRHCVGSCEVAKQCPGGRDCSLVAGWANEFMGVFALEDVLANHYGLFCSFSPQCERCCRGHQP